MTDRRHSTDAFHNRELSWIEFDGRVLEEATDPSNPLLERLRFLAISANNLDEFFEVRVAGLLQAVADGVHHCGPDGMDSEETLRQICGKTRELVSEQYRIWNEDLRPALAAEDLCIGSTGEIWDRHGPELQTYLIDRLMPVLTPITIDPAHPFPRVENKALCIAGLIRRPGHAGHDLAVVTIPRVLPRLVPVKGAARPTWVFLGELVRHCFSRLFYGHEVLCTTEFRVTRNSNLYVNEEDAENLLEAISAEIRERRKGDAVRLEMADDATPELESMLVRALDLSPELVFRAKGPVNLHRLMHSVSGARRPDLEFPAFHPADPPWMNDGEDFFERLREGDVLLHHPFDSFNPIAGFVQAAANDPKVLAIKVTLYRTGDNSPVVRALLAAARAGKQVTAIVELKARFDEATNIQWAREMEDAGVQVVYGLVGLKTHCKLCLLVRDEGGRLARYAHLGTGNYNPTTARIYTDLSLLTAAPDLTQDVGEVFNLLTSRSRQPRMHRLLVAPGEMLGGLLDMIEAETAEAEAGRPARIIAKSNALVDHAVIQALYAASRAGVEIDLIVRGICCLRPGLPGMSDRIRVRSVVGRFLEHSRIYWFHAGGAHRLYAGSADLMPRNLRGRVEVLFPIDDPDLARHVRDDILEVYLEDRRKVRVLGPDGVYRPIPRERWVDERDPHTAFIDAVHGRVAREIASDRRQKPSKADVRRRLFRAESGQTM
jgi:polyphosphate kinase